MKYKVKIEAIIDVDLDNDTPLSDRAIIIRHLKRNIIHVSSVGGGGYEMVKRKDYPILYKYQARDKTRIISIKRK